MKTAAALLIIFTLAATAHAKPKKHKDKGHDADNLIENITGFDLNGKKSRKQIDQALDTLNGHNGKPSTLAPLQAIRQYIFGYQQDHRTKGLPPGLQKKVARGGSLPPGWQKKVSPGLTFPSDLWPFTSPVNYAQVPRFGTPGHGIDYYSIGNRLLKMNRSDNRILDILDLD